MYWFIEHLLCAKHSCESKGYNVEPEGQGSLSIYYWVGTNNKWITMQIYDRLSGSDKLHGKMSHIYLTFTNAYMQNIHLKKIS